MPQQPIRIFIAYSRKDITYLNELKNVLKPLVNKGSAQVWYDGEIVAGSIWEESIKKALHEAEIILLLLSTDSLASDYFYEKEVADALERHRQGQCKVVPVIIRACLWKQTNLAQLQVLPQDAKPIAAWHDVDAAYESIGDGVGKLIDDIQAQHKKTEADKQHEANERCQKENNKKQFWQQLQVADDLFKQQNYLQALATYTALQNWDDKADLYYTDAQPHIIQRLMQCKKDVQYSDLKKRAFDLYQQAKYKAALQATLQALQYRTDPDLSNLKKQLNDLITKQTQERTALLQKIGMGAVGVLLLLLLVWGVPKITDIVRQQVTVDTNTIDTTDPFAAQMVQVQGGTFTMGCTAEQSDDCYDDEKPAKSTTVDTFYISKYEVTQAQWQAVMGNNPSNFKGDNLPVERVSYDDIQTFLQKLNAQTGKSYSLPTEAEWEYAARGGSRSNGYKYAGSNSLGSVGWYYDNSGDKTHPVGQKQANELGLYDMSGNVWEWTNSLYDNNTRVVRGGSWYSNSRVCRVSNRDFNPVNRLSLDGFRVSRRL